MNQQLKLPKDEEIKGRRKANIVMITKRCGVKYTKYSDHSV